MAGRCLRVALLQLYLLLVACTAATPEELMSEARAAMEAGELRTAEIHLKNLLQQDRNNAPARQLLAQLLLETGDVAGAEQSFRLALEAGADAATVGVPMLAALVAQLKYAEAIEFVSTHGLPTSPDQSADVAVLQGAAHRGLNQVERAIEVYRAALDTDPSALNVRTELAATLLAFGQGDEGRALLNAVLEQDPNFSAALLVRGRLEATSGQRAAAEATLQRVVELERPNAARSQRHLVAMTQLIEVQIALGKVDAAAANADAFLALNERNPFARFSKALVEIEQNALESAEQRLEALIADAPQYWPAHRLLGAINVRQEQFGQAMMFFRTAVTNDPADNAARLQLAELYIRQGDIDAARALMEGSPVAASDQLFFAFAAGASERAGLQEQAKQLFEQSEQRPPSDIQQVVGLSSLYAAAGEFDRAIRLLQTSSSQGGQGQQVSDYLLTLIHIRQGDLRAADEVAARLEQQQRETVWPLNLRGAIALMRSDFNAARTLFSRALELEPRNVTATLNMARLSAAENDSPRAERYFRQALEIDPAQPAALTGLAQLAMLRGDLPDAKALLERTPESPTRTQLEAELLVVEGRFDEAAQLFGQVYAVQPSEAVALRAYDSARRAGRDDADAQLKQWVAEHPEAPTANFALANAAIEKRELDVARRHYETVIARHPDHAVTLNNLAWVYGELKDSRAVSFGERAHAAAPDNPAIADTLGWLYVQFGDAMRGLPLVAQAATALPQDRDVQYHWAAALAETGDSARANEILGRVLANGGEFASRADAEQLMRQLSGPRP
jgi:putative PEP-CTERM system TPR-repeat lipoprotein